MNLLTRKFKTSSVAKWNPSLLLVSLAAAVLISLLSIASVQAQEQKREIISDDFTKNRRQGGSAVVGSKGPQRQSLNRTQVRPKTNRVYRLASSPTTTKPGTLADAPGLAQLGITIWRLRPATVDDAGARIVVREKSSSSEWMPERVQADTRFREGDYVRLSVESPTSGYLYIVNRDLLADGTTGDAVLIYPWADTHSGENRVRPGKVIDIPAQEDNPSYFTARPTKPNQAGEVLTFIVSRTPLDLDVSQRSVKISNSQMAKWEKMWTTRSERYEMEGGAGEAWTKQEQQAARRTRARQLTRDDPAPQTIYRVATSNKLAFLVNVQLAYK